MLREQVSCLRREEAILKDFLASLAMVQENKEDQEVGGNLAYDGDNLRGAMEVCVCMCVRFQSWKRTHIFKWQLIDDVFLLFFIAYPIAGDWYRSNHT